MKYYSVILKTQGDVPGWKSPVTIAVSAGDKDQAMNVADKKCFCTYYFLDYDSIQEITKAKAKKIDRELAL